LAVRFPRVTRVGEAAYPGIAFIDQLNRKVVDPAAVCTLPVWPVQLFEAAGNLAIFSVLALLWRRRRFDGQIFLGYVVLYAVLRFMLEFLRGDVERGAVGILSTSQAISLAGLIFALALWPYLRRRPLGPPNLAVAASLPRREKGRDKKPRRSGRLSRRG
jgi:prolipoprotein diacylglyceryltransferase